MVLRRRRYWKKPIRAAKKSGVREVGTALLDAYLRIGKVEKAAAMAKELLADVRMQFSEESPQLAGQLASIGALLLQGQSLHAGRTTPARVSGHPREDTS